MTCKQRKTLWEEYSRAVVALFDAVDDLSPPFHDRNFTPKLSRAQLANSACRAMRNNWEKHIQTHACDCD